MSQAMKDTIILRPDAKVYGTVIELGGNAASLLQFYMTDSTKNFLRGSLYFYAAPNKDSLQPVVDYIKKDIFHIVQTLQWKSNKPIPPPPPPGYKTPIGTPKGEAKKE